MLMLALLQIVATQVTPVLERPASAPAPDLPFAAGELLSYDARVSLFGRVGEATLRVDGGCRIEGRDVLRLSSDVTGGGGIFKVSDATRSWVDAGTFATVRYQKEESSPLGAYRESVSVHPLERRWENAAGHAHRTAAALPLDELSLLYYVRTLRLERGEVELRAGHFDAARNPITMRVLGNGSVQVPAGRFDVTTVELRVRDPRRYRGTGVIRIDLSTGGGRVPVRIRTTLPGSTPVTLELREQHAIADGIPDCR